MTGRVVVVGGGVAGCSAALEAAKFGFQVTLVDEHPQSLSAISLDAPYFYGSRLSQSLGDAALTGERVLASNSLLLEVFEAGPEVLVGTCVWGCFRPVANNVQTETSCLGLADDTRSWLLEYDHLILAPGARDVVLSFPGWELPGVLGVAGATVLLERYQALSPSGVVILGSGNAGLRLARSLLSVGIKIAGIVEVAGEIRGSAALAKELSVAEVPFFLSSTIAAALGRTAVEAVRIVTVDGDHRPTGEERDIVCDTVCMAFGMAPSIDLASLCGCQMAYDESRGGWAPVVDDRMATSVPGIYVVGDAAGTTERMILDSDLAAAQGRRAAQAIAIAHAKLPDGDPGLIPLPVSNDGKADENLGAWLRSLVATGGHDVILCQCENVTRRELLDLSPPKYLKQSSDPAPSKAIGFGPVGEVSQDMVKRLTRVGMGHCQGRRCRDQSAMLLADAAGIGVSRIKPGTYRSPVRPLPLTVISDRVETDEMRNTWPIWFQPIEQGGSGGGH